MGKLDGKVAIITGSSRGLGRAICIEMAKEGADVVGAARTDVVQNPALPGTIYETADAVRALGRRALPLKIDVTRDDQVEEMVRRTLEEFGRVDILVNAAAVTVPGSVRDVRIRHFDLILRVNLRAPFVCTRAVLEPMIAQGGGSIVNVSAMAATRRDPSGVPYGITKAGLERLSWGLAAQVLKHGVAVNAVYPARPIDTPGLRLAGNIDTAALGDPSRPARAIALVAAQPVDRCTGRVISDDDALAEFGP